MKIMLPLISLLFLPPLLIAQSRDSAWVADVENRTGALFNAGDLQQCVLLTTLAVDTARTRYGAESWETTYLMDGLAMIQKITGDYVSAEKTASVCVSNWKKISGERSREVAESMNLLGFIRSRLGNNETVEQLLTGARQESFHAVGQPLF